MSHPLLSIGFVVVCSIHSSAQNPWNHYVLCLLCMFISVFQMRAYRASNRHKKKMFYDEMTKRTIVDVCENVIHLRWKKSEHISAFRIKKMISNLPRVYHNNVEGLYNLLKEGKLHNGSCVWKANTFWPFVNITSRAPIARQKNCNFVWFFNDGLNLFAQ